MLKTSLRKHKRRLFVLTVALIFGVGLGVGLSPFGEVLAEQARAQLWTDASTRQPPVKVNVPSFAKLADHLKPSVVSITVMQSRRSKSRDPMEDFFRHFFGGVPEPYRGHGIGTGFIINQRGHILTNAHVVENASQIFVQLHDGTRTRAQIVATDPPTDVALLQIPSRGKQLPVAVLGDSDSLQIGDWVVAIGNPFGLDYTVTTGIVSALERYQVDPEGRGGYHNYIQTDASINPGNSGGPLFNLRGEVVGINAAMNVAGQGIGFAIPINMAKTLLPTMARDRVFRRSWLGVATQPVTKNLAKSFGLSGPARGALVSHVVSKSPAARYGVKSGDIILEFNSKTIERADQLRWYASTTGVGKQVPVVVLRNGKRKTIKVKLSALPGTRRNPPAPLVQKAPRAGLGVAVSVAHPSLLSGVPGISKGVVITSIDGDGQAARGGLKRGDVVVSINGHRIGSVLAFNQKARALRRGKIARFRIIRERRPLFLAFEFAG